MENQPTPIIGYRELSQQEINLINEIKEKGVDLEQLIEKVKNTYCEGAHRELNDMWDKNFKWVYVAKTHLQEGLMALTRAVAKPESF